MALSATIIKLSMSIADMDRHYYQTHELTVAQHPSESDQRLVIRLIAYALNAHEDLHFTKGLCVDDEPELWLKSLTDEIELWIDFGQLDEKRIRKACGRAKSVVIYTYNLRKAEMWWEQIAPGLDRYSNLSVFHVKAEGVEALVKRNMQLQCNIQEGDLYINDDDSAFTVEVVRRK